jgi:hypothetical protein
MSVSSVDELRVALDEAAFERILGTSESAWIDFKGQPYPLNTDRGTWELCKDIAAFANAGGGCILIGFATERPDASVAERAAELRPVPVAMANRDRYRDVIAAGVFPVPGGLDVCAYPAADGACYLAIWVRAQNDETRPFLVRYMVDAADRRVHGFGWPVRVADAVTWQACEQFQSRLSLGGLLRTAMEQVRVRPLDPIPAADPNRHVRLLEALDDQGPPLIMQLVPQRTIDLTPVMFGDTGIAAAVRRRRVLRPRGFHLLPANSVDVRGPNGVEWGSWRRVAIDTDGVMMAAARVNDHALAWTMGERRRPTLINSIALVELVNDFFRLFNDVVVPASGCTHDCWSGSLLALEMQRGRAQLMPGWSRYPDDEETATSDDYRRTFALTGNADRDTYNALVLLYALFRLGPETIPFCRDRAFSPAVFAEETR